MEDHLACPVCYEAYNTSTARPWDLGCGHSLCEQCIRTHPRSFRYCPECRARASNPHVNIALLRLLEAMPGGSSSGGGGGGQGPAAAAGARQRSQSRMPAGSGGAGAGRGGGSGSGGGVPSPIADILNSGHHPQGRLGSWLNKLPANMPLGGATATAGHATGAGSSSSVATHQSKIATWRSRMWVWLAPLLGFIYLVSPLDLLPDFLPIIGWLDDLLVCIYLACSVWRTLNRGGGDGGGGRQ